MLLRLGLRLGKIEVMLENESSLILKSTNIRRFKILPRSRVSLWRYSKMFIDGNEFDSESLLAGGWFENLDGRGWKVRHRQPFPFVDDEIHS